MRIGRSNWDFGNSTTMTMIDGYYIEFPTNVVKITAEEAEAHYVSDVEKPEELKENMMISIEQDGEKQYYLVGSAAENHPLGNRHIHKLHNKTTSIIPYATFLAGLVYYYEAKKAEYDIEVEREINIDYFSTMLPIWLLVKTNKFSEMQDTMAKRFIGEHKVEVLTPGFANEYTINVAQSKCRIEGEVARWALKKTFTLEDNPEADQFKDFETVVVDLGGGTIDVAHLQAGLKAPKSRDSLNFTVDIPYLDHVDKLRQTMPEHFSDVRELDEFIVQNIGKSKMERKDGNSGEKVDLKAPIVSSLDKYAELVLEKVEDMIPVPKDKTYKYAYIGGVADILSESIGRAVENKYTKDIFEQNHVFPTNARFLNLYALEILSINDTKAEKTATKVKVKN
ncbi:ParM/StbA family protein [Niallia taxi]|uniref:ParM/StbA family protein n=1 Tax=Niallia taxi TaxID=2499688 RepID=UPI0015F6FC6A|nr:ParM/StbA family protein [Niallia taxi]